MIFNDQKKLQDDIVNTRNESLSYFNFNGERINQLRFNLWEGNQKLLDQLHAVSNKVWPNKRIHVIFMVPDTTLWDVYAPIYSIIKKSDLFKTDVITFVRQDVDSDKDKEQVIKFFFDREIDFYLEGFDSDVDVMPIDKLQPDVIFYTLGSHAYPDPYKIEYTSLFCRTCYLSYGFLLVNEENYQFNQDFHHAAWTVFASTERELTLYNKYRKRVSSNIILTGYPKFDLYRDTVREFTEKPNIIWAPHWTIGLVYPELNLGTFDKICMPMLDLMRSMPQYNFIFKPHPNLKYACGKTEFMNEENYKLYLNMLEQIPNVSIWNHGDYFQQFINSEGMITDSVSFLAEYLPTKNPLLFLNRSDREPMSDVGELLIGAYYHGETIDDIKMFIEQCIENKKDPKREERLYNIESQLNISNKPSSEIIVDYLLDSFGKKV